MDKQPNSHFCFICGVKNVAGVQVRFYETHADDGSPEILAEFCGQPIHQGYPGRMHGGVLTGILDETMGRAVNYGAGEQVETWGVTANLDLRFLLPVPLDVELTARGRITRENRRLFQGSGEVYLPDGRVAVTATGKFWKMPLDEISDADPTALGWQIYPDEGRNTQK
ncbi:MAG: PaaI family thioesterase [Caldilineaceae bacterium]|nr:PaaI family thioesterase [Caldilineaceae bacterium]